jgi:hypothetical protein
MPQSPTFVGSQPSPISAPLPNTPLGRTSPSSTFATVQPWVWIVAAAGGLGVLVVAGFVIVATMGGGDAGGAVSEAANGSTPLSNQRSSRSNAWQTHRSEPGGYQVDAPVAVSNREMTPASGPGQSPIYIENYLSGDSGTFSVAYSDNPTRIESPEQEVEKAGLARLEALGGQIIETRNIRMHGAASKLYVIEQKEHGFQLVRQVVFVLTPTRLYEISSIGFPDDDAQSHAIRFLTSFKAVPTAPGAAPGTPAIATTPPVVPPPSMASAGSAFPWQQFRSVQGKYAINFPGQPQHREDQHNTPQGNIVTNTDFIANANIGGAYMVSYTKTRRRIRNPKEELEKEAPQAVAGVASGASASLVEKREIAMPGAASKLYVLETSLNGVSIQIQVVFVLTADTFYHVSWTGPKDTVPQAEVTRFMTSFRAAK